MKGKEEIEERLNILHHKLVVERQVYSELNQIDMLSSTGSQGLKHINRTKGEIKALKWVLSE